MCANTAERKLVAILSTDVVGYWRLMAEDEAATTLTGLSGTQRLQASRWQ